MTRSILALLVCVGLLECGHTSSMLLMHLAPGMARSDVLQILGPPETAQYRHGEEHLIYMFREDNIKQMAHGGHPVHVVVFRGDTLISYGPADLDSSNLRLRLLVE